MKKQCIILLFLLFSSSILVAQVEKGKWLLAVYSNLGLDIGKEKWGSSGNGQVSEYKYTEFNFTPEAAYFVMNKLSVGLFMDYQYYKDISADDNDTWKNTSFTVGPFVRYYILEYKKIWPYASAGLGFGSGKKGWDGSNEQKNTISTYRFGGGATYFLNDNVGLDLFVGYDYYAFKYKSEDARKSMNSTDSQDINSGLKMKIGVVVTVGK